jgi:predicted  nucleic acid-binding Zn-ribbon protein
MTKTPFHFFIDLVHDDQLLDKHMRHKQQIEADMQSISNTITEKQSDLSRAAQLIRELKKKRDTLDRYINELRTKKQQKEKQMEHVTGAREYSSLHKEITECDQSISDAEDQFLELIDDLEQREHAYVEQQEKTSQLLVDLQQDLDTKTSDQHALDEVIAEKQQERTALAASVPEEWVRHYAYMRTRVSNPVLPIENGHCSGCGSIVPTQAQQKMERNVFVSCQNCYRTLYMLR